ncbi:hypothetical protein B296_00036643, partial [Ensete ventricosum]
NVFAAQPLLCFALLMVSVSIIMRNKLVRLPSLTAAFLWASMIISKAFTLLPTSLPPKSNPICSLPALGIVMSLSDGLANVSLKYNSCEYVSMGFYQMDEIAVTPTIVLA